MSEICWHCVAEVVDALLARIEELDNPCDEGISATDETAMAARAMVKELREEIGPRDDHQKAVTAERERCAKIAEDEGGWEHGTGWSAASEWIAKRIRSGQ